MLPLVTEAQQFQYFSAQIINAPPVTAALHDASLATGQHSKMPEQAQADLYCLISNFGALVLSCRYSESCFPTDMPYDICELAQLCCMAQGGPCVLSVFGAYHLRMTPM